MKQLKIGTIGLLFVAMLFGANTFAQRGNGWGNGQGNGYGQGSFCNNIPNLSTEQQTKISDLRTAHWKKMQDSRNQLAVKSANLQTLRSTGDLNAINKTIDEMGAIRTNMQKNREQHFQDVRSLLNADQKVYFDSFNRGRGNCQAYGRGYGRGNGQGFGRGFGRCGGGRW